MAKYILKRLILTLITISIAFTITYFITRMVNKTPDAISAEIQRVSSASKGKVPISEVVKNIRNKYDFHPDWNSFVAFGHYIKNMFNGNFGTYFLHPATTIPKYFANHLKYTFIVAGLGFLLGTTFGFLFGIFAGYKRGKLPDIAVNAFSILFVAIPSFVLASALIIVANKTDWPTQFMNSDQAGGVWPMFKTLIIPISIITVTSFAAITYYIRNEVVEVLKSDYVATARSKGLSEIQIFFSHVLKNIMIPAITIILPRFIYIMLGSMIIEIFFNVPGSAKMISLAITTTEVNVILFSVLFFTSLSLFINIVIDVLYTILDPRIIFAEKSEHSLYKRIQHSINRRKNMKKLVMTKGGQNE